MNNEELYDLIEKYFLAETTPGEEQYLRQKLLSLSNPDEKAKSALAVMGYASFLPKKKRLNNKSIFRAAVAVGVILITGAVYSSLEMRRHDNLTGCIAYVQGQRIDNEEEIMKLISYQLSEMADVSDEMGHGIANDFNEIRDALKFEEL